MRAFVTTDQSLSFDGRDFPASVGRTGRGANKQEGDGATPIGLLPLRKILYRPDRLAPPRTVIPVEALTPTDGWCDDPASTAYNQPVQLPITASAETLWRDDHLYDIIGVLGWNDSPAHPGRGSAIFLHLRRLDGGPTDGCIALALEDLLTILAGDLTEILVTDHPAAKTSA